MNPNDHSMLVICAFRYCLGRMTYIVSEFCDYLMANWAQLDADTKSIIKRELEEKFDLDSAFRASGRADWLPLGMDCDRAEWERVRKLWSEGQ